MIQKIFQKYNIQLSLADIAILLTIINRSEYTYKKANYIESLHSITKPTCPFAIKLIEFLEKKYKIDLLNDTRFINSLNKILTNSFKKNDFLFINYNINHVLINHIKKTHSTLFYTISEQLTNLKIQYDKLNIPLNFSTHNVIILTMYIATKKMELKRKNPQVILHTKEGEYWKLYLQAFFSLSLNKTIDFLDINLENLNKTDVKFLNISCVITDTPIECEHIPVILISSIPTQRNLEEIRKSL
ncbi:hypothetical protein [Bacillus cereus group sp. BfR-BA-01321]|nr:hypothetical protein [Bacillus cereus group sp. BfR-BA-01321]